MTEARVLLAEATRLLADASVDSPRLSAEVLLAHVLGRTRLFLAAHPDAGVPDDDAAAFAALSSRRAAGEPVAYLIGVKEFFGRPFAVDRSTLIPRPETELMIESVLDDDRLDARAPIRFLDLGTGSGCIAVTLAAERPAWTGTALDASRDALAVARRNAEALGVAGRLSFVLADMRGFAADGAPFDIVMANPPYVAGRDLDGISREVKDFEPTAALVPDGDMDAGGDGMALERAAADVAARLLRPGGLYLAEHGLDQKPAMELLLKNDNWYSFNDFNDLNGKSRFIKAQRR